MRMFETQNVYNDYEASNFPSPVRCESNKGDLTPETVSHRKTINYINELHAPRLMHHAERQRLVTESRHCKSQSR